MQLRIRLQCAVRGDIPKTIHDEQQQQNGSVAGWSIKASPAALRSINPIRDTMQTMPALEARGSKLPISLSLGDPTSFPEMCAPQAAAQAFLDAIAKSGNNGYCQSCGTLECRRAVAEYLSRDLPYRLSTEDIVMTAGCSQAIQFCIAALASQREDGSCCNLLVPRPGFPLYKSFCSFYGVDCREYDLVPEQRWEIDLKSLQNQADTNTVGIVICNPGNPCGSVYSFQHLKQLAEVAKKLRIPIISDEIYANIAFAGNKFVSMGTFGSEVPVLAVGGISKRWFVPGWRLGWICVCDPHAIFKQAKVIEAFGNLANMQLSTATLDGLFLQAALPTILQDTPPEFFTETLQALQDAADLCYRRAQKIRGLSCPSKPQGSMYIMVRVDFTKFKDLNDDIEFTEALIKEEALSVLPGAAFGYPGWIRLLFAAPTAILEETWNRLDSFCKRHFGVVRAPP